MNDSPCIYCFSIYSCLPNTFLRVFAVIKKIFLLHNLECVLFLFYFHFEHIPGLPLGLLPFIFNSSTILGISLSSIPPDMAISSESWLFHISLNFIPISVFLTSIFLLFCFWPVVNSFHSLNSAPIFYIWGFCPICYCWCLTASQHHFVCLFWYFLIQN